MGSAMRAGQAYVWADGLVNLVEVDQPENEIDGDLFWIWREPGGDLRVACEEWQGQAASALEHLIAKHLGLAGATVSEDSPGFSGLPVGEVVGAGATFRDVSSVEAWYHGTTASRLASILEEGIRGDMPMDLRAWRVADVPPDVAYLSESRSGAESHATRQASMTRDEAVVLEVDPSVLDAGRYREDRDFPLLPDGIAWASGAHGDVDAVSASLTLTGFVGYQGGVPPEAIVAVHRRNADGDWEREERAEEAPRFR
jgi:hypothetical protein